MHLTIALFPTIAHLASAESNPIETSSNPGKAHLETTQEVVDDAGLRVGYGFMDPQFMPNQVVTANEAADLIKDGDAVIVGGMGAAESLLEAIENRFLDGVAQQPQFEAVGGVHTASHGLIYVKAAFRIRCQYCEANSENASAMSFSPGPAPIGAGFFVGSKNGSFKAQSPQKTLGLSHFLVNEQAEITESISRGGHSLEELMPRNGVHRLRFDYA